jgi:hypothetical protein
MNKILISYANERYATFQTILSESALSIGKVDNVINFGPSYIQSTDFYQKNKYILDQPRGNGFWLYKPKIILDTLENANSDDTIMYCDSGLSVIGNLTPLFDIAQTRPNDGIMLFRLPGPHINRTWTKRDCFILTGCDSDRYWNGELVNGAMSLWCKTERSLAFLKEWLKLCRDPRILTDDQSIMGQEFMDFRDHRHDQSVLSLLAIKHELEVFRSPCQWAYNETDIAKFNNSNYEQLVNHHRGAI